MLLHATTLLRIKALDMEEDEKGIINQTKIDLKLWRGRRQFKKHDIDKALPKISEFAAKFKQCINDQEMAECAVKTLRETTGALKHLSAVMMKAAHFGRVWKEMKDHCHSLSETKIKSVIEKTIIKYHGHSQDLPKGVLNSAGVFSADRNSSSKTMFSY